MTLAGPAVIIIVIAAATAFGLLRRRTDGKFRSPRPAQTQVAEVLSSQDLDHPLGGSATLVMFTSSFCQPCKATRQVLRRVTDDIDAVEYAEIDAEIKLDLTRKFNVMRTPTVLILDSEGAVCHRAAGQPRYADVVAALAKVIPLDQTGADPPTLDPNNNPLRPSA